MAKNLPDDALLVADAGFIGYEFWKSLIEENVKFLVRVGGNVRLLTELGYAKECKGTVYLWPDYVASQSLPPLGFRQKINRQDLQDYKDRGYQEVLLLS